MRMWRVARPAAAVLLVALTAACSGIAGETLVGGLDTSDTVRFQGRVDKACRVSFGNAFQNVTDRPIVITDAQFGVVDRVKVLGIVKLPEGSIGVGNPPGFPPRELRKQWREVRELVGSTVGPRERLSFVIGLRLEAKRGAVSDLVVEYEIGGRRFEAADEDSFVAVARKRATCTDEP